MIRYRRAVVADVTVMDHLLRALAAHDGGAIKGSEQSLRRHGFGPDPRFRAVLAEWDGVALGLCLFFPEYSSWRGAMGVFVQDLYVGPEARGLGIGKGLMAAALTEAVDWAPEFLTLMVHHDNTAARAFYAAQGFVLREKADVLVMEGGAFTRLMQR